ncbi:MAG TPA: cyclic nucleotide-binding domain-containing protein [Burkholderiales bacterium]|nr:cyclic nucleotide-binding domain-containing protein [Burkholderiales bacterium]
MSLESEVELIRQVPILCNLELAAQKMLCFVSERCVHEPGQPVIREGERADATYIIIDGSAEVNVGEPDCSLTIDTLDRHNLIGETGILSDSPHAVTVVAKTRLETLRVPTDVFRKIISGCPEAALHLSRLLIRHFSNIAAGLGR